MSPSRSRSRSGSRSASPPRKASTSDLDPDACPFLIRVFVTKGRHTPMADFEAAKFPLRDEWQVYGWRHSTPSSLIRLMYPTLPSNWRSPQARYAFRHIYVDASSRGLYRHKDLISFSGRDILNSAPSSSLFTAAGHADADGDVAMDKVDKMDRALGEGGGEVGGKSKLDEEEKTLDEYGFVTGDLLSVSLHVPEPRARAAATGGTAAPVVGRAGAAVVGGGGGPGGARPFGWDERKERDGERGAGAIGGHWARGQPLPPASNRRDGPSGSWRGGAGGGGRPGGGIGGGPGGFGIRGAGKRGSPDRRDGGREERERSGMGRDRRERSPERAGRGGDSWSRR